ncbi:MAG: HK97 gp10 family phage protein [Candidatus Peribacteria bacterium]|nr:HK97 gp10 family phage protein [Candidatus Peribacteria bacterium]
MKVKENINTAIKKAIIILEGSAKQHTPVDTGALRGRGRKRTFGDLTGELANIMTYAIYVHEGTGIYARGGNGRHTPRKYPANDGNYYFTRGKRAKPFLEEALSEKEEEIYEEFNKGANILVTEATK